MQQSGAIQGKQQSSGAPAATGACRESTKLVPVAPCVIPVKNRVFGNSADRVGASADMVVCACLRSPFCFLNIFFQVDFEARWLAQLKSRLRDGPSGVFVG